MNQETLKQLVQAPEENEGPRVRIEDLKPYSKVNCKKCYGKGFRMMVKNVGKKDWAIDHYNICPCVLKHKNLAELMEKVKKADEEAKNKEQFEQAVASAQCDHENCQCHEHQEIITPEIKETEAV